VKKSRKTLALLLIVCMLLGVFAPAAAVTIPVALDAPVVTHTGTVGNGGAPWRLYSDGTLVVDAGFIEWDNAGWQSPWDTHRNDVYKIIFTGPIIAGTSLQSLFSLLGNVVAIEGLEHFDTSNVINMGSMFVRATSLMNLDLSTWDTSNVKYMQWMFYETRGLTSLDVSTWNTSNVMEMHWMFWGASNLAQLTLGEHFSFRPFNQIETGLPAVPVGAYTRGWRNVGTGTVDNPQGEFLFSSDELMANFDGATMADTWVWHRLAADDYVLANGTIGQDGAPWRLYGSGIVVVDSGFVEWQGFMGPAPGGGGPMFGNPWTIHDNYIREIVFTGPIIAGASLELLFGFLPYVNNIEGLDYFDTSNVTSMSAMFWGASSLTNIEGLSAWDTGRVADMHFMFADASSLTSLDLSNWNTSNVRYMAQMFSSTRSALTHLNLSGWDTSNVVSMGYMFASPTVYGAAYQTDGVSNLSRIDGISDFDTRNVRSMTRMFWNANSLTSLDLSRWDTGNVECMSQMFRGASGLTSLNVSTWDIGSVRSMQNMFMDASGLTHLDVSRWNTSNVGDMHGVFSGATGLTQLDLSNWDTGNVWNMAHMFDGTSNLTNIQGISDWDVSNVDVMAHMFLRASSLTTLDLSRWNTSSVRSMQGMFAHTSSLVSLDLSGWDTSGIETRNPNWTSDWQFRYAMFTGANNLRQLTLGENFEFVTLYDRQNNPHNVDLPSVPGNATYTGHWQNVGNGTPAHPQGSHTFTSAGLMANFHGPTMADTWVWQPQSAVSPTLTFHFRDNNRVDHVRSVPLVFDQPLDSAVLADIMAQTGLDYGEDTQAYAFWGWFTDQALTASWRTLSATSTSIGAGLRRPVVGTEGFCARYGFTISEALFEQYRQGNTINLHAVWSLWGDVNDDDVVDFDDATLLQMWVAIFPNIQLVLPAGNVTRTGGAPDFDDVTKIQGYVAQFSGIYLGRPCNP